MSELLERHKKAAVALPSVGSVIGGKRVSSTGDRIYTQVNPATGQGQAEFALSDASLVDDGIAAARAAFPHWRDTPGSERRAILERLAELLLEHAEELGTLSTLENGVTQAFGGRRFVEMAAQWTRYYAGWADRIEGICPSLSDKDPFVYTIPEPFGVVAIIITWNAPLLSLAMKIPPALAAGNTVVLKPAEFTPFTSVRFLELAQKAGLPDGVLNLIIGGPECGKAMTEHADISKISFTGGPPTAQHIMRSAASNLVPVLFELGGKGANLIFDDADLEEAIPFSATYAMVNSGQGCALPTRLLVHDNVYDRVVDGIASVVGGFRTGDPLDPETFAGPLINQAAVDKVAAFVDRAESEKSGELILGGSRPRGELSGGYFYEPTVFAGVDPDSHLAQNEVFGPVLSIIPFKTEDEAVRIANGTRFGLTNYVQTADMRRARRMARRLRSGTVGINGTGNMHVSAPFGGIGLSGFGREGGKEGMMEFLRTKTVLMG